MKIETDASLLLRFWSSVTNPSGSTTNCIIWSPIAVPSGTVQLTKTRCSEYGATPGILERIVVPSGVVTSISVAGEAKIPRF